MEFRTDVQLPASSLQLTPSSRVVLLGSCFAEEVGSRLSDSLPEGHVVVNPCGVLYNPESIAQTVRLLLMEEHERRSCLEESLFQARDGRWHSWLFSTKFTSESSQGCVNRCMESLATGFDGVDLLVITLGTDHCYRLRADGRVVANCHKEPAAMFEESVFGDSQSLHAALQWLLRQYPSMRILLTVSPYRYAKYGFHESQLSKARLLLLVDACCRYFTNVDYFPAYEILLDELRDYRFYAADMLHPSEQAADYIFERFSDWCFTSDLRSFAAERLKELKRMRHRVIEIK